ncbi:MEST-like protein [Mya arenaria]|uniref:MEST-like protein n=1 Tax=Mya arenaria TaxID=6604 RepID=A0ABY7G1E6_MYAAR|nr:MEST-like protein [Mya arenaria]
MIASLGTREYNQLVTEMGYQTIAWIVVVTAATILGRMKSQFSKIIMLDMLGYGFSDKPLDHDYLITEQADIHEALLTSLSISRAHREGERVSERVFGGGYGER